MKIALVHDYIKEFGGAERVLMTLHEMFPEAPIYTAFLTPESTAAKAFANAKVITSWANFLICYKNLYSPLRFLAPLIWESFDFSGFDVVILSSSWFITKPMRIPKHVKVICYCHTPPRYLYGYRTAIDWQRYWPVKIYGHLLGHFLRLYDFLGAKRVDKFIANSKNVAARIEKFYRKPSVVIYPPVDVAKIEKLASQELLLRTYFLVASRISSEKGLPMAMEAANKLGVKLKVVGEFSGLRWEEEKIDKNRSENIEFMGRVSDEELYKLYAGAKAFLVMEPDVDFGMTPVEAMAAGTPVVAYKGGGYLETVIEGKTGMFFEEYNVGSLIKAMKSISEASLRVKSIKFNKEDLQKQAAKFSKEIFIKKMREVVYA
ncbi:MAG: glycosyltransferase [Patescibacteria group bacterium]